MGAWNTGNFDNDTAADLLAEQRDSWVSSVEKALQYYEMEGVTPMEAEDDVMTYLEMMHRIANCDRVPEGEIDSILAPSILPERTKLVTWRDVITAKHVVYFGEESKASERYKTICNTFDELIQIANDD